MLLEIGKRVRQWRDDEDGFLAGLSALLMGGVILVALLIMSVPKKEWDKRAEVARTFAKHAPELRKNYLRVVDDFRKAARKAERVRDPHRRAQVYAEELRKRLTRKGSSMQRYTRSLLRWSRDMRKTKAWREYRKKRRKRRYRHRGLKPVRVRVRMRVYQLP